MSKKRLLFLDEAPFLTTGYANYTRELLSRLVKTEKYDIAALSNYCYDGDQRMRQFPWKIYGNMPQPNDTENIQRYNADPLNQLGKFRFEEVLVDYRPDCVISVEDYWYYDYCFYNPLRKYYRLLLSPTVDALPQDEHWVASYISADGIVTYTDWAGEVLIRQSNNRINYLGTASPGANLSIFQLVTNRKERRAAIGMDPNIILLLTCMRNQKRKLFHELFVSFRKFLDTAPPEIAQKTYLYCHTTFPDVGINIPRILRENNLGCRVLFTYVCRNCGSAYPAFFNDIRAFCKNCNQPSCFLPNSQIGVDSKTLFEIYALADLYVQYASSEGISLTPLEAAGCGIPVMGVDYSGLCDVVKKLNGIPIKVKHLIKESETHCLRAVPDNNDFVEKLIDFFKLPEQIRQVRGFQTRKLCEQYYDWDKNAKIWEDAIDKIPPLPTNRWNQPFQTHQPNLSIPPNLPTEQFLQWVMINVAGRPELINTYYYFCLLRDLNVGGTSANYGGMDFGEMSLLSTTSKYRDYSRDDCVKDMVQLCEKRNLLEQKRYEAVQRSRI